MSEHTPEPALSAAEGLARTPRSRTWATGPGWRPG